MKAMTNYDDVKVNNFEMLPAGGYVLKITDTKEDEKKEYFEIIYDIAEGEHKGFYDGAEDYKHRFFRSYKDNATCQGMLKAFIEALDQSNGSKLAEKTKTAGLVASDFPGKVFGAVISYEEYEAIDGNVKQRPYIAYVKNAEDIRTNNYTVPGIKALKKSGNAFAGSGAPADDKNPFGSFTPVTDEDLPF